MIGWVVGTVGEVPRSVRANDLDRRIRESSDGR